ncbi:MAG: DNA polymerase [Burkholderiaceae bacterium]
MELVLDIETDSLNATKVYCIVGMDLHTSKVYHWAENLCYTDFVSFCKNVNKFIMHNGISFDAPVLNRLLGTTIKASQIEDTLIMSQICDPMRDTGHSLSSWGEHLGYPKLNFTDFSSGYSEEMLQYCKRDVEITRRLYFILSERIKEHSRESLELEYNVRRIIDAQERNGFALDMQKATILLSSLEDKSRRIENEFQEMYPPYPVQRFSEKTGKQLKDKIVEFNPASRQQIAEKLMEAGWKPEKFTEKGHPIVDEGVLKSIDGIPFASKLAEYLLINKRTAQIKSWLELVEDDGRVHGKVLTLKAISSRMAHYKPNMAQIPAVYSPYGKECRECWTVSDKDNNVLVGCDASQLELRALAHYMNDSDYIKEVVDGDIHTVNQKAAGLETRDQAKTFIYAFIYGAGPAKIGLITGGDADEGQRLIDSFLKNIPALKLFRERVDKAAQRGYLIGLDKRKLFVRNRHAATNLLLQGAGAIICKQWLVEIDKLIRQHKLNVKLVASVHDEYQFECNKLQAKMFGEFTKQAMKETERILNLKCPLDSEYKVGQNWSETH